ncbi:hypothetical protein EMCRGX_G011690 [Ephydatia muelleri]
MSCGALLFGDRHLDEWTIRKEFSPSQSLPIESSHSQLVFIASETEPQFPIQVAQQKLDLTIGSSFQSPSLALTLLGQSSSHSDANAEAQASKDRISSRARSKKHCIVEGCLGFIAPSMWRAHMSLHAQGILPVPLQTPITSSLREVVNLLVSRKAPQALSNFMAGGRLIALNKNKEGSPPDIRPIVVGESLRSHFILEWPAGQGLRRFSIVYKVVLKHWMQEEDFVVIKVDMTNAFNLVSRQAVLDECSAFFPEILPLVSWWGPTWPMLLALHVVLQKLISTIDADDECLQLLLQAWYLEDGVLAGKRSAVLRALNLIEELGLHIGLVINFSKCKDFNPQGSHLFPPAVKSSLSPNLEILGVPIARNTPPRLSCESLKFFDDETITVESVLSFPLSSMPCARSWMITILMTSSPANKARLLSASAPHASSWLSVVPSLGLGLHLDPAEANRSDVVARAKPAAFDVTVTSPLTPATLHDTCNSAGVAAHKAECRKHSSNDPKCQELGSPAATCRHGGDVVARHNCLQDNIANFCRRAHLSVRVEVGYGLARDHMNSRPADILVQGWNRGKPAAFDVTVTSPLTPVSLNNTSALVGAAAYAAECRKHAANDTSQAIPKPKMLSEIYSRLKMSLVRSVARAIMGREAVQGLVSGTVAKAAEFFQPHQFGVSCSMGAEKIAHGLRAWAAAPLTQDGRAEGNEDVSRLGVDKVSGINLSCGSDPHDRLIPVSCSIEEVVLDHPREGLSHHGYFEKVKLKSLSRLPQNIAFLKILPTSSPVHSHSHQKLFGHFSGPQSSPYPSQCRALGVSTTSDSDQSDYLSSLLKMRLGTSKSSDGRGHSLSEEAGHLKSHMRELGEATASLERSHDLETHLLKGNRTLQEQSVECEQPKEEYRWLREELNVTRATVSLS